MTVLESNVERSIGSVLYNVVLYVPEKEEVLLKRFVSKTFLCGAVFKKVIQVQQDPDLSLVKSDGKSNQDLDIQFNVHLYRSLNWVGHVWNCRGGGLKGLQKIINHRSSRRVSGSDRESVIQRQVRSIGRRFGTIKEFQ